MDIKIKLPKHVTDFMNKFQAAGYEIYIVGGAVRDLLLRLNIAYPDKPPITDAVKIGAGQQSKNTHIPIKSTELVLKYIINWDFATNAKPEQIQKLFKNSFYNNDYGTVSIPINIDSRVGGNDNKDSRNNKENQNSNKTEIGNQKQLIFEVTPYRKESDYSDNRHPDKISWAKTLKEDLLRRDFTINAMAYDGRKLIDITGGVNDLKNKLIRSVGDPDLRFCEDGLRLLRAIRFASELGFLIEENTRKSITKNSSLIKNVSAERIRDEFLKILSSDHPAEGILFLKSTGLLKIILPEVDICFSVAQKSPKRHHIYDVGTHSVEALRYCSSADPITRFATLIHDIGKAKTFIKDDTGLITFHNHEHASAKLAGNIAERFKLSKDQKNKLVTLVRYHMFSVTEKQTDKALRRFIRNVGTQNLDDILSLRLGDRIGSGAKPTSWRTELFKKRLIEVQKIPFSIKDLKISGNDVMKILKIKPGPKVGQVLQKIFNEVDNETIKNKREILLEEINKYKSN